MRRKLAVLGIALPIMLLGIACDDAPKGSCNNDHSTKVDEDDCKIGPGDGVNEPGPGR